MIFLAGVVVGWACLGKHWQQFGIAIPLHQPGASRLGEFFSDLASCLRTGLRFLSRKEVARLSLRGWKKWRPCMIPGGTALTAGIVFSAFSADWATLIASRACLFEKAAARAGLRGWKKWRPFMFSSGSK